jgi:hypothetical protein
MNRIKLESLRCKSRCRMAFEDGKEGSCPSGGGSLVSN